MAPSPVAVAVAWLLLGLAVALNATGDPIWDLTQVLGGAPGYTSTVASVAYLASYPAMIGLLGPRRRRRDTVVLLDGTIVALATWLAIWVVVVRPGLATSGISFWDWLPTVAYPPLDVVLVVALWRIGRGDLRRSPAWLLLIGALGVTLAADTLFAVLGMPTTGAWDRVLSVGWLVGYGAIAAAAVHPDMRH